MKFLEIPKSLLCDNHFHTYDIHISFLMASLGLSYTSDFKVEKIIVKAMYRFICIYILYEKQTNQNIFVENLKESCYKDSCSCKNLMKTILIKLFQFKIHIKICFH